MIDNVILDNVILAYQILLDDSWLFSTCQVEKAIKTAPWAAWSPCRGKCHGLIITKCPWKISEKWGGIYILDDYGIYRWLYRWFYIILYYIILYYIILYIYISHLQSLEFDHLIKNGSCFTSWTVSNRGNENHQRSWTRERSSVAAVSRRPSVSSSRGAEHGGFPQPKWWVFTMKLEGCTRFSNKTLTFVSEWIKPLSFGSLFSNKAPVVSLFFNIVVPN